MTRRPHAMTESTDQRPRLRLAWLAAALLAAVPRAAPAATLLADQLVLDLPAPPAQRAAPAPRPPDLSLDFDLLGQPPPPVVKIDDQALKRRAWMLGLHQQVGLGLAALTLATTVVGQLNYGDKYGHDAPVTGRYQATHAVLAYSTLGLFAADGAIALLAPGNPVKKDRIDRVTVHKAAMAAATAGMIAQGIVGAYASAREGRLDQAGLARTHLLIGYGTLVAVAVAVGVLVL